MKIAVLGTRGFPNVQGGVETHCENLYPLLIKRGCEVVVFTRKPYVNTKLYNYKGVKLIHLPCPKHKFLEAFLHTFYGIFAARKINPDILHIHAIGPSLFTPLARLLGIKVVITNHGSDYKRKKWNKFAKIVLKLGEFFGSKWSNAIICISEFIAQNVRQKYKRKVAIIPNGVAIPQILKSETALKKFDLEKRKYILAVGRFVPEKGFHDLINAFYKLYTKNWKLVIVGKADHEDKYSLELKKKARENPSVILTGFLTRQSLQELYSHAGLFVLPSYYEGLPIALLEALSYGLSCIVSDIPANREVKLSESRFFKTGDIQELTGKIDNFINNPLSEEEKSRQISATAEQYNWEKISDMTLLVYNKVINNTTGFSEA